MNSLGDPVSGNPLADTFGVPAVEAQHFPGCIVRWQPERKGFSGAQCGPGDRRHAGEPGELCMKGRRAGETTGSADVVCVHTGGQEAAGMLHAGSAEERGRQLLRVSAEPGVQGRRGDTHKLRQTSGIRNACGILTNLGGYPLEVIFVPFFPATKPVRTAAQAGPQAMCESFLLSPEKRRFLRSGRRAGQEGRQ